MKKGYLLLLISLWSISGVVAQQRITLRDVKQINQQANTIVKDFENVLNLIAFNETTPSEVQEQIGNSFKPGGKYRIFYSKNSLIEDDINPDAKMGNTAEVNVEKYLNDFNLQYEKGVDNTISFSDVVVSNVKYRDYFFIKVKYSSVFGAKNGLKKVGYAPAVKEALLRMEPQGKGEWKAFFMNITFYNPANAIDATDNDAEVAKDDSENAEAISAEELKREQEKDLAAREELRIKKEAAFNEFSELANAALTGLRYKEALEYLEKAKENTSLSPALEKKIVETKRLAAEYTYENLKSKADLAKSEHRFIDAIALYKQALTLNPSAFTAIDLEIKPIAKKVDELSLPMSKLDSKDYEGAIASAENLLKENKKTKGEFPELFYIEGVAYQALFEKSGETKFRDKALENFNQAIIFFSNYIDARVARAEFLVKHKNDGISAIADYDVLTTNLIDASPKKPVFFAAKAKLKDGVNNPEGAVADYQSAIALSPKTALYYCSLGELQFRLNRNDLALKNLSTAITLDPKMSDAYYYRGLNYIQLKSPYKAGADFIAAEAGISDDKKGVIQQKSDIYLAAGQDFLAKASFIEADTAFNSALAIRNCNSIALFGKAEIRFVNATTLKDKGDQKAADAKYQEAIDLYKRAIICNSRYSDAHYKQGLSHSAKSEYELAIESFQKSIVSDSSNVKSYIEQGNTYQTIGKYQNAADVYAAAVNLLKLNYEAAKKKGDKEALPRLVSNISLAYQLHGQALYYVQQYDAGIIVLEKALESDEKNAEAYYYLGLIYDAKGDLSKAIKNYNEGIKYAQKYQYFFSNGKAYFKIGEYENAIRNYDQGIKLDELYTYKGSYYVRGLSYYRLKQWENAYSNFTEYAKSEESAANADFLANLGITQLYLNKDAEAEASFNKALALKNDQAQSLYGLGLFHAKAAKFDKTNEFMEKAFVTGQIFKDQFELEEKAFLTDYIRVKENKTKFNTLKKTYATAKQ